MLIPGKLFTQPHLQNRLHTSIQLIGHNDSGTMPYGIGHQSFTGRLGKEFSCDRNAIGCIHSAAQYGTCRPRAGTFASAPRSRSRWRAATNCSNGVADTRMPSRMRLRMHSVASTRSCHECDDGAERATVMAAPLSAWGRREGAAWLERGRARRLSPR